MAASLQLALAAMADPTRRAILGHLRAGEATVSTLARAVGAKLPAFHKHLGILQRAGLVATRKAGRVRRVRLLAAGLREATELLDLYRPLWAERFDASAPFIDLSDMDVT